MIGINAFIDLLLFIKNIVEKEGIITLGETVKKEVELPSDDEEVELIWFILNGEYYGIERELLVDVIKKHGRKMHNKPVIV